MFLRGLLLAICWASFLQYSSCNDDHLRPWYHFTRESGEMNDPNGLQWRIDEAGKVSYELFFQMRPDDPTACWGSEGKLDLDFGLTSSDAGFFCQDQVTSGVMPRPQISCIGRGYQTVQCAALRGLESHCRKASQVRTQSRSSSGRRKPKTQPQSHPRPSRGEMALG